MVAKSMMLSGLCNKSAGHQSIRTLKMFNIDVFLVIDIQDKEDTILMNTLQL